MKRTVVLAAAMLGAACVLGTPAVFAQAMNLGPAGMRPQNEDQKQAQQQRHERQRECARQAKEQNLRGGDRDRFMRDCTRG